MQKSAHRQQNPRKSNFEFDIHILNLREPFLNISTLTTRNVYKYFSIKMCVNEMYEYKIQ